MPNLAGFNWLITPAAPVAGDLHQREAFLNQTWFLVLTGIVDANVQGNSTKSWKNQTVTFTPPGVLYTSDNDQPGTGEGPLYWALNQYGIQRPPILHSYDVCFSLQEGGWAPFVALSSIRDDEQSINAGFALNMWRPTHFLKGTNLLTNNPIDHIFQGMTVDLGVRDTDAYIMKLSYNISLLGRIVFVAQGSLHN